MKVEYFPSVDEQVLKQTLYDFSQDEACRSLVVFACDANQWQPTQFNQIAKAQTLPLVGGIFPEVIFQQTHYQKGFVVVGLNERIEPIVIQGLSDRTVDLEQAVDESIAESLTFESMMVFVDGLSSRVGEFVDSLFALFGSQVHYIGGGAGSLSFESKPCVFSNQGLFQDAAVLALLAEPKSVQVGHGWRSFESGHVVTAVEKNVVKEIDYRNALDVYQSAVQSQTEPHLQLNADNFFEYAQSFPLGIKRAYGEHVVRDPIAINEQGALICVGELSIGDHIDILTANPEDLIASTQELSQASAAQSGPTPDGVLFINCISRALFLKERFDEELQAARGAFASEIPVFGALVLGEIANSGVGYLEFYNKTSVIARM